MPDKDDSRYLKEILDLKQLKKLFEFFSIITSLDVALFDFAGRDVLAVRKKNSICHSAQNCSKCREYINAGSIRSSELGEPYICACGCGLIMCFSPVVYKERLIGSIACGPAVLWDADEIARKEFLEKTNDMTVNVDIDSLFDSITSCTCTNMTAASQILYIIVNSLAKDHSIYLDQRAKITEQQAKIAELVIDRKISAGSGIKKKGRPAGIGYPVEREKELIACMQSANAEQSKKNLNILLSEIFTYADGNTDTIRVRLFELVTLFSRAAVKTGAPVSEINRIAVNSFNILNGDTDFEQICFLTTRAMEEFIRLIRQNLRKINLSENLSRAVDYISINYAEELTLKTVANSVYISSFYLSHLFRREMNTTFSDYLCKFRIEKAKELLKEGIDIRVQEIAEKTGFNDPNYFTKSFKKTTGVSPREYKNFFKP